MQNSFLFPVYILGFILCHIASDAQINQQNANAPNQAGFINFAINSEQNFDRVNNKILRQILNRFKALDHSLTSKQQNLYEKQIKKSFAINDDQKIIEILQKFEHALILGGRSDRELAAVYYLFAQNDLNNFRIKGAYIYINKSIENNQFLVDYAIFKAHILQVYFGQTNNALRLLDGYRTVVSNDSDKYKLYYAISNAYFNVFNYEQAITYLNYFKRIGEKNSYFGNKRGPADCEFALGMNFQYQGNYRAASEKYFNALDSFYALKDTSREIDVLIQMVQLSIDQGKLYEAKNQLTGIEPSSNLLRQKDFTALYFTSAKYSLAKNDLDLMTASFNKALFQNDKKRGLSKEVSKAELHFKMGLVLINHGYANEAIKYFNLGISTMENQPELFQHPVLLFCYQNAAFCIEQIIIDNRTEVHYTFAEALRMFKKCIELMDQLDWQDMPLNEVTNATGLIYVALGQSEGITLLEKTTPFKSLSPYEKIKYFNTLAIVYYEHGLCKEALALSLASNYFIPISANSIDLDPYISYLNTATIYDALREYDKRDDMLDKVKSGYCRLREKDILLLERIMAEMKLATYNCR